METLKHLCDVMGNTANTVKIKKAPLGGLNCPLFGPPIFPALHLSRTETSEKRRLKEQLYDELFFTNKKLSLLMFWKKSWLLW
jgi:hypothetical protein